LSSASPSLDEDIPTLGEKEMELNRILFRLVGFSLDEDISTLHQESDPQLHPY